MIWKKGIDWLLHKGGVRRRLLILGLTFLGVALVLNTLAGTYYTRGLIKKNAGELQKEIAARLSYEIEEFMESKTKRLVDFAASASFHELGSEQQRLIGLLLLKNDAAFTELAVLNNDGREALKISERRVYLADELSDQSQTEKFKRAAAREAYISPVYTSDKAEPFVTLSVPIRLGPRQVLGVVAAETNLKMLWDVVGDIRFGRAGYAYLVDGQGNLIAHRDSSLVLSRLNLSHLQEIKEFLKNPAGVDPTASRESLGISGQLVISTYAPLPRLGWAVIVEEPIVEALSEIRTLQRYSILLLGVGLLVGALIIIWVSDRITNPIQILHHGAHLLGSGNLDHRVDIKSGDEIEELAEAFNKMALELKNSYSNLEHKVEQRTQEVSALYEVTTTVNQSLDLDSVLQAVIQKLTHIFQFDITRVYLFDPAMEELRLRAFFEINPGASDQVSSLKRGQSIIGRVADSGEALLFADVQSDPRYQEWSLSKTSFRAGMRFFAVFPIKTKSRIFGIISFSGKEVRMLREDEIRLLNSMSEHVGLAVEKAGLFEQIRERSEHLAVLNTIGAAVSRSLDLDVVLREAIEKVVETLRFDASWIYLRDSSESGLHVKAHRGLSDEAVQAMARRTVMAGIGAKVLKTGERLVFEDIGSDERYRSLTGATAKSLGFTATAGFPIRAKESIIGVLRVANKARRHFAPDQLQLIESIVQEIGVAVENATLFARIKEQTAELEKTNHELQEATRVKSEFIAAMSHELRTPLNIVLGNAELTGDGFFGDVNYDQREAMRKISYHGRFLLKLINDVLTLSRLEAKKMSLDVATVDIADIIGHVQNHVEQLNRDKRLEVLWKIDREVPPIVTDATKLEEILQNLLGNAFKFTPHGRVEIRVRNLPESESIEFSVADTGIGIENKDLQRIFNQFEQLNDAHTGNYNGVGLGLSIVKRYLELMHGEIRVESQLGQGSTFIFSIPRVLEHSPRAAASA